MLRWLLPLLLVALVAGGAGWLLTRDDGADGRTSRALSARPPAVAVTRDCRTHIEGRLPPADPSADLTVGPVRFRGFRATSRFAIRDRGRGFFEIRNREYHGLKFIAEVRAGADVVLAIAPENRDMAGLLYDRDVRYGRFGIPFEEGERAVRFRACSADHPASSLLYGRRTIGAWTQFNGGFILTKAQCLRLDVYVRGGTARRYAEPFGRRGDCSV